MSFNSYIFFSRILKSIFSSFLVTYASALVFSLRSINLVFSLYYLLYAPLILVAVFLFVIVTSRKYLRTNVSPTNRFYKIVKGLSFETVLFAILCSVSALLLSMLNPFCHDKSVWYLLNVGRALTGIIFHYENVYFERDSHFPIIQTTKYSMFMSELKQIISRSMKKSFAYLFYIFIPLYAIEPTFSCNVYFIINLWFSIALVLYLFYSFEYIVYLTMTEQVTFPIVTIQKDGYCLLNALNTDTKIVRLLALYDLYQTTLKDADRRKEIFNLSFAGNVPQSWKIIFNFCINNIKSTTEDITNAVKYVSPKSINRRNIPNDMFIKLNDNSKKQEEENVKKKNTILKFFENVRIYNYFFAPLDKEKSLEEFEETVWCCYVLSNLAVVSLKEDQYGIVREQLGQIVSTILNLKNQLEIQINVSNKKKKKIEYLKLHTKTCAVMLALNFGTYANDIGLDDNQLISFKKIVAKLNDY
ncbi:Nucleoporin protein Ndc1-Nup [Cinara cedri]|uniref:Nucleoporin protein Ndc1-Nup n=1 Tax=Cinara cedri TaxID=506608 RepID=A0A5E4MM68_9HEMI|nr:Nucleoporin protein Ndc1-Nup [Cinara cedri]